MRRGSIFQAPLFKGFTDPPIFLKKIPIFEPKVFIEKFFRHMFKIEIIGNYFDYYKNFENTPPTTSIFHNT